jgi:hypothetical protein
MKELSDREFSKLAEASATNTLARLFRENFGRRFLRKILPAAAQAVGITILTACADRRTRWLDLNPTEKKLLKTLGRETLTGEELAERAGYPYNSNIKATLSSLRKRGHVENLAPGYRLTRSAGKTR